MGTFSQLLIERFGRFSHFGIFGPIGSGRVILSLSHTTGSGPVRGIPRLAWIAVVIHANFPIPVFEDEAALAARPQELPCSRPLLGDLGLRLFNVSRPSGNRVCAERHQGLSGPPDGFLVAVVEYCKDPQRESFTLLVLGMVFPW